MKQYNNYTKGGLMLEHMKKRLLVGVCLGLALVTMVSACGSTPVTLSPQPTVTVTAVPTVEASQYTDAEQEILAYVDFEPVSRPLPSI